MFLSSTNNIWKEIAVLECENAKKNSKLALSARSQIHIIFFNVSVLSVHAVYSPTISNKRELHWLYMYADVVWDLKIYISEALARAYKLHVHDFFFSVGTFGGLAPPPPPPPYQKAGYATGMCWCYWCMVGWTRLLYVSSSSAVRGIASALLSFVCMYVCIMGVYVCMCVCVCVCILCVCVCVCVCIYVCMFVCMYLSIYNISMYVLRMCVLIWSPL